MFIPKLNNPTLVTHFRSIALSNINYKILAKVLYNKLKSFLNNLTSGEQSTFILGCSIYDNILIAQEVAHAMYSYKGKNPLILIKLGLEKAFEDCLGVPF